MKKSIVLWIAILVAALWANGTFAQSVPEFVSGEWVLPANGPGTGMSAPTGVVGAGVEQWRPAVEASCGSADCVNWMMSVIACESGGDPGALGAQGEVGILQFHPQGLWGAVADPYTQIDIAASAYAAGLGFHWVCAPW